MVVKRGSGGPPRGEQVGFRHLSSRPDLRTTQAVSTLYLCDQTLYLPTSTTTRVVLGWQVTADTRLSLFSSPGCSVAPGFYLRARYVSLGPRTRARCLSRCGSCPAQRERREHHDREHFPFDTFTSREYWREKIRAEKSAILACFVSFSEQK